MDRKPSNQELRTRKDLLLAARRLLKQGLRPTMDEVAKEALISRATAYRYFKNVDAGHGIGGAVICLSLIHI